MAGLLGGGSYIVVVVGLRCCCCCCRFVVDVAVARPLSSGHVAPDGGVRTTSDELLSAHGRGDCDIVAGEFVGACQSSRPDNCSFLSRGAAHPYRCSRCWDINTPTLGTGFAPSDGVLALSGSRHGVVGDDKASSYVDPEI